MILFDTLGTAAQAILGRPRRTVLTSFAIAIGIAAAIATVGIAQSGATRVSERLAELRPTVILVRDLVPQAAGGLSAEAESRFYQLPGVEQVVVIWRLEASFDVTTSPGDGSPISSSIHAVSPGAQSALGLTVTGASLRTLYERENIRVALIGQRLASTLGARFGLGNHSIFINGVPFAIVGIVENAERESQVLDSILVSDSLARRTFGDRASERVAILTVSAGAAETVASQVSLSASAEEPTRFEVVIAPDPRALREDVEFTLGRIGLAVAGLLLATGAIAIANAAYVSVLERTNEIGLRLALGATRAQIATQIVLESAVTGSVGAVIGVSIGLLAVASFGLIQSWTPTLDPLAIVIGLSLGPAIGSVAGAYPARRAASIEPIAALRSP